MVNNDGSPAKPRTRSCLKLSQGSGHYHNRLIDKKIFDAKRVCQPILVKREEQVQHDEACMTCGVLSVAKLAHSPTPFASSSPRQSLRHGRNPKCAQIFLLVQ